MVQPAERHPAEPLERAGNGRSSGPSTRPALVVELEPAQMDLLNRIRSSTLITVAAKSVSFGPARTGSCVLKRADFRDRHLIRGTDPYGSVVERSRLKRMSIRMPRTDGHHSAAIFHEYRLHAGLQLSR
jgi:hypothetical protein